MIARKTDCHIVYDLSKMRFEPVRRNFTMVWHNGSMSCGVNTEYRLVNNEARGFLYWPEIRKDGKDDK